MSNPYKDATNDILRTKENMLRGIDDAEQNGGTLLTARANIYAPTVIKLRDLEIIANDGHIGSPRGAKKYKLIVCADDARRQVAEWADKRITETIQRYRAQNTRKLEAERERLSNISGTSKSDGSRKVELQNHRHWTRQSTSKAFIPTSTVLGGNYFI